MSYFDGVDKIITGDLLNFSILRADTKNLNVPIPSEYKYPVLESETDYLLNATNFKVIENNNLSRTNLMCDRLSTDDGMSYRNLT